MEKAKKPLTIILPSFRDARILATIASIRMFDDLGIVKILVIDGGSEDSLLKKVRSLLGKEDILISEPDDGIFDALNKGLENVDSKYTGWIGSDDLFSGLVKSSDVQKSLEKNDLFVTSLAFINETHIRRVTHSYPSSIGLSIWGLHNPHYATFGRSDLLKSARFETHNIAADIEYFLNIYEQKPRIGYTAKIGTLQGEGGYSNASISKILAVNKFVYQFYRQRTNPVFASIAVAMKLTYKYLGRVYFSLRRVSWQSKYPEAYNVYNNSKILTPVETKG